MEKVKEKVYDDLDARLYIKAEEADKGWPDREMEHVVSQGDQR